MYQYCRARHSCNLDHNCDWHLILALCKYPQTHKLVYISVSPTTRPPAPPDLGLRWHKQTHTHASVVNWSHISHVHFIIKTTLEINMRHVTISLESYRIDCHKPQKLLVCHTASWPGAKKCGARVVDSYLRPCWLPKKTYQTSPKEGTHFLLFFVSSHV